MNRSEDAYAEFRRRELEDGVILSFGRDYFFGVRCGAGWGALCTGWMSVMAWRMMKVDQRTADHSMGFGKGVRNPNFPRSVLRRGFRTQPMLAVSCLCLRLTCCIKIVKTVISNWRCREFDEDDVGYELISNLSEEEQSRLLSSVSAKEQVQPPSDSTSKLDLSKFINSCATGADSRKPTYMDGVAVGLAGSIFDCYLPQKPASRYLNACFGYGV